uniref:Uncharacterized protein n=1 Tax=Timema douglasi TaxID=61478 RepID=A0A7R8VJK6_TIMDO|nr:unnamed protein product [Timema douglasi]
MACTERMHIVVTAPIINALWNSGGKIVFTTDDWFAVAENLLKYCASHLTCMREVNDCFIITILQLCQRLLCNLNVTYIVSMAGTIPDMLKQE